MDESKAGGAGNSSAPIEDGSAGSIGDGDRMDTGFRPSGESAGDASGSGATHGMDTEDELTGGAGAGAGAGSTSAAT